MKHLKLLLLLALMCVYITVNAQFTGTLTIGTAAISNNRTPIYPYFHNSYNQHIYTSQEIGTGHAGMICKVGFNVSSGVSSSFSFHIKIYMGHTSQNNFNTNTAWISPNSLELVYEGDNTFETGWKIFDLLLPFMYNGSSNLVVAVEQFCSSYTNSLNFYTSSVSNSTIYYYSDLTPFNHNAPQTGTRQNNRANIRLVFDNCNIVSMSDEVLTGCNIRYSDPGGLNNYSNNQDIIQTVYSQNGEKLQINFYSFSLASGDFLTIHDGYSTSFPVIGTYTGSTIPAVILSSYNSLTFHFTSNNTETSTGWFALISCFSCNQASQSPGSPCNYTNGTTAFCTQELPFIPNSGNGGFASTFFGTTNVGCLQNIARPSTWYHLRINNSGNLLLQIEQYSPSGATMDVDFACWGPFSAPNQEVFINNLCCGYYQFNIESHSSHHPVNGNHSNGNTGGYPYGNLIDCSYDNSHIEWCFIPNAQVGEFYLLLVTNYNGGQGIINFTSVNTNYTSATTDCSLLHTEAYNGGPYCEGDTIRLFCTDNTENLNYHWSGPNGFYSTQQNPIIPNVSIYQAGTYTVTITLNTDSFVAITSVIVNPVPDVHISAADTSVCSGLSSVITASGADSYNWSHSISTNSVQNIFPLLSGIYSVTGTSLGCSSSASIYIEVLQTFSSYDTVSICPSKLPCLYGTNLLESFGNHILNLTSTNNCDSIVFVRLNAFRSDSTFLFASICEGNYYSSNGFNENIPGIHVRRLTNIFECDSIVILNLSLYPTFQINHLTQYSYCGQANGTIAINTTGGAYPFTYTWNNGATTQNLQNIRGGIFLVTVTDANSCSNEAEITVDSIPDLQISSIHISQDSCGISSGSISLEVTGGNPPYNYSWSNNATNASSISGLAAGVYSVSASDQNGCAKSENLSIYQIFQSYQIYDTVSICPSELPYLHGTNLLGSFGNHTIPYATVNRCDSVVFVRLNAFRSDSTFLFASICEGNYYSSNGFNENIPGIHVRRLTNIFECDSIVILNLSLYPTFQINYLTQYSYCGQANGTISINTTGGAYPFTYTWSNGATTQNLQNIRGGIFFVTVRDANGCSNEAEITVDSIPDLQISSIHISQDSCGISSGSISLEVTGGNPPYNYSWSNHATNTSSISGLAAGVYAVLVNDLNGCAKNAQITIYAYPLSVHIDSIFHETCNLKDGRIIISITNGNSNNYQVNWGNNISNHSNFQASNLESGVYNISISDEICETNFSFTINHITSPVAEFEIISSPPYIIENLISFHNTSSPGNISYLWNFADSSFSTDKNPTHAYLYPGNYNIILTVSDNNQCTDTFAKTIEVIDITTIYIPNSFRPASTIETNRTFKPVINNPNSKDYSFRIWDRWHNLVFQTTDIEEGWDGKMNGKYIEITSVFVYEVIYRTLDHPRKLFSKKGSVTIIR